jgi:hypothetical protein
MWGEPEPGPEIPDPEPWACDVRKPALVRPPAAGLPGTELKALLASLGITDLKGCDCNIRAQQSRLGWSATLAAGVRAVLSGVVYNPVNYMTSIVNEAISRAESKLVKTEPVMPKAKQPVRTWAYGITTVPSRLTTLLPRTITSLAAAGFDKPHLFVDGGTAAQALQYDALPIS